MHSNIRYIRDKKERINEPLTAINGGVISHLADYK